MTLSNATLEFGIECSQMRNVPSMNIKGSFAEYINILDIILKVNQVVFSYFSVFLEVGVCMLVFLCECVEIS